jgi:hypothetical protein
MSESELAEVRKHDRKKSRPSRKRRTELSSRDQGTKLNMDPEEALSALLKTKRQK